MVEAAPIEQEVVQLANAFSRKVRGLLSGQELKSVLRRNAAAYLRDPKAGSCATHDYLDANEVMAGAFKEQGFRDVAQIGEDAFLAAHEKGFSDEEADKRADAAKESPLGHAMVQLWNDAWTVARLAGFQEV